MGTAAKRIMTFRPDVTDLKLKKVLMSNRQYAALRLFDEGAKLSTKDALSVDQRSLGSLYYRGYLRYDGDKFQLTAVGKQALGLYDGTNVMKEHPSVFSTYIRTIRSLANYSYRDVA